MPWWCCRHKPAEQAVEQIRTELVDWASRVSPSDDITMVMIDCEDRGERTADGAAEGNHGEPA